MLYYGCIKWSSQMPVKNLRSHLKGRFWALGPTVTDRIQYNNESYTIFKYWESFIIIDLGNCNAPITWKEKAH